MSQRTKVAPKGAKFKAICLPIPFAEPVISTISPAKVFLRGGNINKINFSKKKKNNNFRNCSIFRMLLKLNMIFQAQTPFFCYTNPEIQYVTGPSKHWDIDLKKKRLTFKQLLVSHCSFVQVQNTLLKTCFVKAARFLLVGLKQIPSAWSYTPAVSFQSPQLPRLLKRFSNMLWPWL